MPQVRLQALLFSDPSLLLPKSALLPERQVPARPHRSAVWPNPAGPGNLQSLPPALRTLPEPDFFRMQELPSDLPVQFFRTVTQPLRSDTEPRHSAGSSPDC